VPGRANCGLIDSVTHARKSQER